MQIERDYRDFRYYAVYVRDDIVFIAYDYQDLKGMIYPVPKWIRLPITDVQRIGEFIQSQAWQWDEFGEKVATARPLILVPEFLYGEVNAMSWNEFVRAVSLCYVLYHKTRLIVCPCCHRFERTNCFFHNLLDLNRESRGPLTAEQIGAAVSEGANLAWVMDQATDAHVRIAVPAERDNTHQWN